MIETTLRSLNKAGLERFQVWLEENRAAKTRSRIPDHLLNDDRYSSPASIVIEVPAQSYVSGFEAAEILSPLLRSLPAPEREGHDGLGHPGLWGWLALYYFDQLCDTFPGAVNRYIPETDGGNAGLRYYRHLLAGPFRIYEQLGSLSGPALSSPLPEHNVLYNALADHQDLIQNPAIVEAMNLLYFDTQVNKPKRGLSNPQKAGSLARFFPVMHQLELTYDLLGLSALEVVELLPEEFEQWCPGQRSATSIVS